MLVDHSILAHISTKLMEYQRSSLQASISPITPIKRWVVAYSGGVDSTVLLHALVFSLRSSNTSTAVTAIHINHQLSAQAQAWQQHCHASATALGVDFYSETVTLDTTGKGIEAAARDARYAVFEAFLEEGDCLLLGHHQSDQAETLLLRLLRGAGVTGLCAMPESRAIGTAQLLRPLLSVSKAAIIDYAQQQQLLWVDDESNDLAVYDRNFLRHQIMPLLSQRWPSVVAQCDKTAQTMRQTEDLLVEVAQEDFQRLDSQSSRAGSSIDLAALSRLSAARKNNVLRYWCKTLAYSLPDSEQLAQIEQQFFSVSFIASSACVSWSGCELRQFSGRLYLMKALAKFVAPVPIDWDGMSDVDLQGLGVLRVHHSENKARLPPQPYRIQWRQGGERCTPMHRQHSQTVKKLLQEYGLETWLRDRIPLIYRGDELAAVGDLWINRGVDGLPLLGSLSTSPSVSSSVSLSDSSSSSSSSSASVVLEWCPV